jgi:enoyl-CoA hydratase
VDDNIILERKGRIGSITLNRPQALNALTQEMTLQLDARLIEWADDPAVRAVVIRGSKREDGRVPFCAGGDIRVLYEGRKDPKRSFAVEFYEQEYRLNTRVFRYPKPYVALVDGVVMGGGVGLSLLGSHRVMTERTLFAMPETGIGLFPDVGATHFLPRCPGKSGLYLGLTGARIGAADAVFLGLGTHFLPSDRLQALDETLLAAEVASDAAATVDEVLAGCAAVPGEAPTAAHMAAIERCFAVDSVEAIIRNLEAEQSDWAAGVLETLATKSPTSLKVTFKQLTEYGDLSFEDSMKIEYRIAMHCNLGHEFYEGIRAVIIDKDQAPNWNPARLEDVTDAIVEAHFTPPPSGDMTFD